MHSANRCLKTKNNKKWLWQDQDLNDMRSRWCMHVCVCVCVCVCVSSWLYGTYCRGNQSQKLL